MEARNQRVDAAREARSRRRRSRRTAVTAGVSAIFAVALGLFLGLRSLKSTEDLIKEREVPADPPAGGVVEELLSEPAVQEMLRGERVEAAAARGGR